VKQGYSNEFARIGGLCPFSRFIDSRIPHLHDRVGFAKAVLVPSVFLIKHHGID
jgi:hypothetical protein